MLVYVDLLRARSICGDEHRDDTHVNKENTAGNLVIMSLEDNTAGSPKQYTELMPVTLVNYDNDITDVKVPFMSTQASENDIPNGQQYPVLDEENYPTPSETEITQLLVLFRGLPREMFINRILVNYSSCEVKLENARVNIMEKLKEMEDFPFGLQAELKRRLHTRAGESVPTKLAQDIHTLLSVLDGGDYSDIKDMLSNGKVQRSQSVTATPLRPTRQSDHTAEIELLTQTVNTIKSDMLCLKQTHLGSEEARSHQIKALKSSLVSLKTDMKQLSTSVSKHLTEIKLGIERIESDRCTGIVQMKSEIRLLKDTVKNIQDICDQNTYSAVKGKSNKSSKTPKHTMNNNINTPTVNRQTHDNRVHDDLNEQCETVLEQGETELSFTAVPSQANNVNIQTRDSSSCVNYQTYGSMTDNLGCTPMSDTASPARVSTGNGFHDSGAHSGTSNPSYADVVQSSVGASGARGHDLGLEPHTHDNCRDSNDDNDNQYSNGNAEVSMPVRNQSLNRLDGVNEVVTGDQFSSRERQWDDTRQNVDNDDLYSYVNGAERGRIYDDEDEDNDDDFAGCIRKRARRFYLGGFNSNITRNKIYNFVNKRGPNVTWVHIWQSRRNYDEAVIRLNVADNPNANLLLDRDFWPAGIVCRPWKSKSERFTAYNNRRYAGNRRGFSSTWQRQTYGRSDVDDYNPYSPLRDTSNIDP